MIEKKKKVPKSPPKKNVNLSLQTKLERSGQPALGLEYITEFLHPEKLEKDHPMYSCSLEGCKSAWGTSFEIFHHVLNVKHQRNFLKSVNPDDATIGDMLKPDVFLKVRSLNTEIEHLCAKYPFSRHCSGMSRIFQVEKKITARLCR